MLIKSHNIMKYLHHNFQKYLVLFSLKPKDWGEKTMFTFKELEPVYFIIIIIFFFKKSK